jgi:dihydropteroate synthase-like protein
MPHLLFVTGKLAEPSLRRMLAELAPRACFEYSVAVAPITVAALATTRWLATHVQPPAQTERIILPGLCQGDLQMLKQAWGGIPVERGPSDLRDLPDFFGKETAPRTGYGDYDIAILAEINHVPQMPRDELLQRARQAHGDGADIIDLGCDPGDPWSGIAEAVKTLRGEGLRVSVDTFNVAEATQAAQAGAELILSVNHANRAAAVNWGCEVVAVPDQPANLEGLDATIEHLRKGGVPFRIDPVLEPIGFGFAASLGRYLEARRRWPDVEMLMGVGNLTELTDVDSAGVNVLLAGFCQEAGIRSVLTTEVINWCRSSVRELDLARRLMHFAVRQRVLPKHLEHDLVLLRDPKLREHGQATLDELAKQITDPNFRIFAERGLLHMMSRDLYLQGADPFALFAEALQKVAVDPAHAFYLGYEMAKAVTALTLGKNYVQDQALRWGFLTRPEKPHHAE